MMGDKSHSSKSTKSIGKGKLSYQVTLSKSVQKVEGDELLDKKKISHRAKQESKEPTQGEKKDLTKQLRKKLKELGVENDVAKLYSTFIVSGSQTISELTVNTNSTSNSASFKNTLAHLIDSGDIKKYAYRNAKGKVVDKYKLTKSSEEVFTELKEKNLKLINDLIDLLSETEAIIKKIESSKRKIKPENIFSYRNIALLVSSVTKLGITDDVAKILVYLLIFPHTSQNMFVDIVSTSNKSKIPAIIRDMCYYDWISEESRRYTARTYSLKLSLYDILRDYVIQYSENIEKSLKETENIISYIQSHPSVYNNIDKDEISDTDIQELPISVFTQNLSEYIHEYKEENDGSIVVHLKRPLPNLVRVYLYCMFENRQGEYKIRSTLTDKSQLNLSDVDFVLLGGYEPKLKQVVFWNAYTNDDVSHHKILTVSEDLILNSMLNGIDELSYETKRKSDSNYFKKKREHIVSVSLDNIHEGIEREYEHYIQDLLEDRI